MGQATVIGVTTLVIVVELNPISLFEGVVTSAAPGNSPYHLGNQCLPKSAMSGAVPPTP